MLFLWYSACQYMKAVFSLYISTLCASWFNYVLLPQGERANQVVADQLPLAAQKKSEKLVISAQCAKMVRSAIRQGYRAGVTKKGALFLYKAGSRFYIALVYRDGVVKNATLKVFA